MAHGVGNVPPDRPVPSWAGGYSAARPDLAEVVRRLAKSLTFFVPGADDGPISGDIGCVFDSSQVDHPPPNEPLAHAMARDALALLGPRKLLQPRRLSSELPLGPLFDGSGLRSRDRCVVRSPPLRPPRVHPRYTVAPILPLYSPATSSLFH